MCGITGYAGGRWLTDTESVKRQLTEMADTITSRGPDSTGCWFDVENNIAIAHRRLAIVDLTAAGHQPMVSSSGRYVIAINGEVYNHINLREQVKFEVSTRITWRGHSDTESLLESIDAFGLEETLKNSVGMFAFVLWDRKKHELYLVRDRIGEKPLYYGCQKGFFLFGSELKALKVHPSFEGEIDRNAIALQLRHNCIPSPYSIYRGIRKLPPGTFIKLKVPRDQFTYGDLPDPKPYWSLEDAINRGLENPFYGSDSDAVDELENLLKDSMRQQMVADVPMGAFLSGGVDSSSVVALMQSQSSRPVKTFSIGFSEAGYNEAEYAKTVSQHLGTEHTELYVSSQQAIDVIPHLPSLYDEPFSDSSQIPTFLVSEMTKQYVTVSLSGDAGDELFGGYNRYLLANLLWDKLSRLPPLLRRWVVYGLTALSPNYWNKILLPVQYFIPKKWRVANLGDKFHKGAGVLGCDSFDALYLGLVSHWDSPSSIVIGAHESDTLLTSRRPIFSALDGIERMMALDTVTYLPDDILVKVDRAAMGVSLETRLPMLDHRVVEFAWRLPLSMKIRNGQSKWILRQLLYKYVPKELIERPKMGFGVPIDSWLRGPLRDWAECLLDESRLRNEGYLNSAPIRKKWNEHLSSKRNWEYHLWDVLMFQSWLELNRI